MDEIEVLRALGRDALNPDPRVKQAARASLLIRADAAASRSRWAATDWAAPRRSRIAFVLTTMALAVIVGSGVVPVGRGPDPAAAAVLNGVAQVAASQPAVSGPGYRHTKSEGAYLVGIGGSPDRPNGIWALMPVSREIWVAADGSGRLIQSRGEPTWYGPADRAAWLDTGIELPEASRSDTRFGPASGVAPGTPRSWPGSLYYEPIDALPTDFGALRQVIDDRAAATGGATDYERFTIIGDMLRETVGAPALRAALYRVAAGLSGVVAIGSVTDRAGRSGIGVAMSNDQSSRGPERRTLIFDPQTSMLLAEEDVLLKSVDWLDAEPPLLIGYNTYLVSDITTTIP